MDLVMKSFVFAMSAREHSDITDATKVVKYEDMVDNMEEELREQHIERLSKQLWSRPTVWFSAISSAIWSVFPTMPITWQVM